LNCTKTCLAGLLLALWFGSSCASKTTAPPAPSNPEESAALTADELEIEYRAIAHESFVRGVYLRETGDALGAQKAFKQAVRAAPQDAGLRLTLVHHLVETRQLQEARAFLLSVVERFEASPEEYRMLARLEMWGGRNEPALLMIDKAVELDPEDAEARALQGQLLIALGDVPGALISFQAADALAPGDPLTQARIAECHGNLGDVDKAIAAWENALALDPDMQPARAALGDLLLRSDRPEEAIALFEEGLVRDPNSLGALIEKLVQAQRYGEAARILEQQHSLDLLQPREQYLYARILIFLGDDETAAGLLQSLSGSESLSGIDTLLGEMAMRDGRLDEARAHFDQAIEHDPQDCSAWVNRAVLDAEQLRDATGRLPRQGDAVDELRATLSKVSELTPDDEYRCHVLLASVYTALRDFEPAVLHLEKGHHIDPDNADVQFNLAMAHQELGHFETALEYGRGVLKTSPNHAAALNFVGYILAERGLDLRDSEALIRRALEQEPDNGYYVDSLGWVLYQRGNYAEAAGELERAVRLTEENDAVILEHLGDAYVKVERLDDAYRVYSQSRQLDPDNSQLLEKLQAVETRIGAP